MEQVKIKDLVNTLNKNLTGIDEYFSEYINYGIDEKEQDGYSENEIMELPLTDELLFEIKSYVMSYFDSEFDNMLGDIEMKIN